jgi:hypothetical protein
MVYNTKVQTNKLSLMTFDPLERQYLLEHFRSKYNECKRSERLGSAKTAQTWAKLQRLFVEATK